MEGIIEKRTFPTGDVLYVATGRLFSLNGMAGFYDLYRFMMQNRSSVERRSGDPFCECRTSLERQFPVLKTPEMISAINEYDRHLNLAPGRDFARARSDFLAKFYSGAFGITLPETLEVEPLPGVPQSST